MQTRHDPAQQAFGSDNYAGVHPEVLEAIIQANGGHVPGYGHDPYSARLEELARERFGAEARLYPAFNGTGANVLALGAATTSWQSVIAPATAHVCTDENGALERVGGTTLIRLPHRDGKLAPEQLRELPHDPEFVHGAQPAAVTISNTTELGTIYTIEETRALADAAHERGWLLHVDGSRIANAAAALGCGIEDLTTGAGADLASIGATKNGALGVEAVLVARPDAAPGIGYLQKVDLQLGSKSRFLAAQLLAMFDGDLWRRCAGRANAMAARLAAGLDGVPGVEVPVAPAANAVFAVLPAELAAAARRAFAFYDWPERPGMVRLMTSWDTREESVDRLLELLREAAADAARPEARRGLP